uniref:Anoctamin n=1 Tax=Plectus sambesii TaxID=2011161 RepID=A0A914X9P3_9BILA
MERKHDRSDSFSSGRNASYLNREWHKPPINDFSLGEFTEKVMQFGYLLMFASAFTLAPVILLIVNFVDLRIDSRRLLWFNRRPIATITADIGMWESIIKFLIFCGIVTNGYLVASRSSFVIELDFGFDDRVLVMLIFENVLLLLIYAIDVVIPDIPSNIKLAIRRENYQVSKILAAGFIPSSHLTTRTSSLADLSPKVDRPPSCNSVIEDDVRRELDVMREASSRNAYINSS